MPLEAIRQRYRREEFKKRQEAKIICRANRFKQPLKQELERDKSLKSALHALIERIQAYPDRKMEVKFRIGEKIEGTGGGQNFDPHDGN